MKRPMLGITAILFAFGLATPHAQAAKPAAPLVPDEVLIQFRDGTTDTQHQAARDRVKAAKKDKIRAQPNNAAKLELAGLPAGADVDAAIAALEADPNVEFAEPNWVYTTGATTSDPYFTNGDLWGMKGNFGTNAEAAWAANHTGSKSVYIGIIDEGINFAHADLDTNIWTNPFDPADGRDNDGNGYIDDVRGWDFANNDNTIYDGRRKNDTSTDSHGTHVAGTIGAESNGAGVVGVNWNVTMISGKFLGSNGGTSANAIKAVDYFTDLKARHGLNIVATSNSWGGGGYSQALYDAIERANAKGILFIAAAGNGGSDGVGDNNDTTPHYPSSYANDNIIAVAAITSSGAKSGFSNYGATSVDIGAPGSGIYSTTPNNTYSSYNGTSMATPHVSGAAALYASKHPGATATDIKNAILSSAVPTDSLSGKTLKGGRLDANAALNVSPSVK